MLLSLETLQLMDEGLWVGGCAWIAAVSRGDDGR